MANILQEQNGKLTPEQRKIAKTIINVGRRKKESPRAMVTALITGIQESGLQNLPIGNESSGGWRQERAIYYPEPLNVKKNAVEFYNELKSVPKGSVGEEAQAVQRSAYPSAYQPHVKEAQEILKRLGPKSRRQKGAIPSDRTGATLAGRTPSEGDPMERTLASSQVPSQTPSFLATSLGKSAALQFINSKKDLSSISEFLSAKGSYQSEVKALKEQTQSLTQGKKPTEVRLTGKPPFNPKEELKLNKINPPGTSGHRLVNWADNVLGTNEGSPRQSKWAAAAGISPSTAWCSAFVAYGLRKEGYALPSDPAYSGSWLNWNQGQHIKSYKKAKPGDLLIFDWGDGGITDHVAIYAGHGQMISGNDSNNSVGKSSVPTGNIVGIVRPTKRRK